MHSKEWLKGNWKAAIFLLAVLIGLCIYAYHNWTTPAYPTCYESVYGADGSYPGLGEYLPTTQDEQEFNATDTTLLDITGLRGNLYAGLSEADAKIKAAKWTYMDCLRFRQGGDN